MKLNLRQILHKPGLLVLLGLLLIIAVAGALLVKINTPFGLGMDPDSGLYIMGARNLLAGNGYSKFSGTDTFRLITIEPPLYSGVLAFIGLAGIDAIRAARLLNILLIGLDLLLFAGLVYYETRNKLLTILAGLLFLFSTPMFIRYTWALTEPLFMTFLLGCFILYYRFLRTHGAIWVVALGFGTAILYLTRYAGIYLAAIWLPAILLVSMPKTRLKHALLFLAGLLPLIVFHSAWNYLQTGTLNNREIYLPGMDNALGKLLPAMSVLEGWFTTSGEGLASHTASLIVLCLLVFILLAGSVISGLMLYKRANIVSEVSGRPAILFPLSLTIPFYIALVLLIAFFYDSKLTLNDRVLSLMWFFGLYLVILIADLVVQRGRSYRIAVYACLLAFLVFSVVKFEKVSAVLRSDGQFYSSASWRVLPSIEYVKHTNKTVIYSDRPFAIYLLTGKVVYQIPFAVIDENKSYEENYRQYDFMRARLIESNGILVLFNQKCHDQSDMWIQILVRGLHMVEERSDACIFGP
jgi:4-amino-4-deoxy-L-arabinose transferase-like glycosyltransferase